MKVVKILGVSFSTLSLNETIETLIQVVKSERKEPFHMITANPEIVMQIHRDSSFKEISEKAGMITPDGIGIVLGSKILKRPVKERVTGVEILVSLLKRCEEEELSVYFLGADEKTSVAFSKYVHEKYPKLSVTGRKNGYFNIHEDADIVSDIHADVLVMAMGSPRAHDWFNKRRAELDTKLAFDVGGGLDVLTGRIKRAPLWIQKIGFEWLYRRILEPQRAKRQKDLYRFAVEIIKERFRWHKKYQ